MDAPSKRAELDHIETWIFDLDNTLYPARFNLFDQVDLRIGQFIAQALAIDHDEARRVQKQYFRAHGTTLRGLMDHHGVAPADFLHFVHDIDYRPIPPNAELSRALGRLPGRKVIFTNGTTDHAHCVMDRLGVAHHIEGVFDIVDADYVPKPEPGPYDTMLARFGIDPRRAIMVEDIARNLAPAAALGMTTVWVRTASQWGQEGSNDDYVHHIIDDLADWLIAYVDDAP
jgi:putative hydrolase of the HAD superfamily